MGEDWEGLYINGKLKVEAHEILAEEALEIVFDFIDEGKTLEDSHFMRVDVDQNWLEEQDSLPNNYMDIPLF